MFYIQTERFQQTLIFFFFWKPTSDTCSSVFPKSRGRTSSEKDSLYLFQILDSHFINISQACWSMHLSPIGIGYDVNDPQAKVPAWHFSLHSPNHFHSTYVNSMNNPVLHHCYFNCSTDIFCRSQVASCWRNCWPKLKIQPLSTPCPWKVSSCFFIRKVSQQNSVVALARWPVWSYVILFFLLLFYYYLNQVPNAAVNLQKCFVDADNSPNCLATCEWGNNGCF